MKKLFQCTLCMGIIGCGGTKLESECRTCVLKGRCKLYKDTEISVEYQDCGFCKFKLCWSNYGM